MDPECLVESKVGETQITWYGKVMEEDINNYYNNDSFFKKFVDKMRYLNVQKVSDIYPVYTDVSSIFGLVLRDKVNVCGTRVEVNLKNIKKGWCHTYTYKPDDIWAVNNDVLLNITKYIDIDHFIITIPEKGGLYGPEKRGPGMVDLGKWVLLISPFNLSSKDEINTIEMKTIISLDDVW
jgi:hypothetical protein